IAPEPEPIMSDQVREPATPPAASKSWTPPRPSDPAPPGSLISTVACWPTSSTGLPRPSGSAL
ncbi:hypothetical protein M9458_007046, partial [Cirrhinus mrigala]